MAKADPTRSIQYAILTLVPSRPTFMSNRRMVRFLGLVVASLLVVILALNLLSAIGASKQILIIVALAWMGLLCGGSPVAIYLSSKDIEKGRQGVRVWEADSRRLAVERLGLDLSAGRLPVGLTIDELFSMDQACVDWRQARESIDALAWAQGELAKVRDDLKRRLDEAMVNLLAEAGAGAALGPSPFLIERGRMLFGEVGMEANSLAMAQAPSLHLRTDTSLESLRDSLNHLREVREARSNLVETLLEKIRVEGS